MPPLITESKLEQLAGFLEKLQKVDLKIIYESISPALKDFSEFVAIMSQRVNLTQVEEAPPEESSSEE
jgi:uncharacterized protein YutE (UPF0331/DUF86 family)